MITKENANNPLIFPKIQKNYQKAYTLAEVLVTLTVIGVVCALTIPTLYKKHEERMTVTKVQKFYATLSKAYETAVARNGGAKYWGTKPINGVTANKVYELLVEPYFQVEKNCRQTNEGECLLNDNYINFQGKKHYNYETTANYRVLLKDGALVWFRGGDSSIAVEYIGVYYDVNGKKGPNQVGVDLFYFRGMNDRILPYGFNDYKTTCNTTGFACTSWIIYEGNTNYLHK